jgi:lysophospholipase L1-like esterase
VPLRRLVFIDLVVLAALAAISALFLAQHWGTTSGGAGHRSASSAAATPPSTAPTIPTTTTTTTTTLPPPGPGFVAGHVTAVGDSVMLDYQSALQTDIPGIAVDAAVSRQWSDGVQILEELKASGQLGAEVIVALGSNGPVTAGDLDAMMQVLSGASRVVFVNTHVDRPWQDPNNAVLANGATRYPNVVVADWATLAAQNPAWFGSDGTHLPIDGAGAMALAALLSSTLTSG